MWSRCPQESWPVRWHRQALFSGSSAPPCSHWDHLAAAAEKPPPLGWSVEDVPRVPGVCRISSVSVSLLAPAEKSVWNRNELSIME